MNKKEIIQRRLFNQCISQSDLTTPQEVVQRMIAMQAQEYNMAKWAIGLRCPGSTEKIIEKALDDGALLRTHLMRPTWHFVAPADIRWLLQLTAPRIKAASAFQYRQLKLTDKIFFKSNTIIEKSLSGGKILTRTEIQTALAKAGIKTGGQPLSYFMMRAEIDGVVCSGPRRGKQFTYALLEERVPPVESLSKEESLSKFLHRFFSTRGPATIQDFAYWSGLTIADAKSGMANLSPEIISKSVDGQQYFFKDAVAPVNKLPCFLLPDYDEYGMSYNDKVLYGEQIDKLGNNMSKYGHLIIAGGKLTGYWRRDIVREKLKVGLHLSSTLSAARKKSIERAVKKYLKFFS